MVHIYPMTDRKPKRPRDPNQLAKAIVDIATGETDDSASTTTPAQDFARQGGLKGGAARARVLSAEERRRIAKKAADARWKKDRPVPVTKE